MNERLFHKDNLVPLPEWVLDKVTQLEKQARLPEETRAQMFKLEKDVPLPTRAKDKVQVPNWKYLFGQGKVGDSFLIPAEMRKQIYAFAVGYAVRVTTAPEGKKHFRVWIIKKGRKNAHHRK